MKFTARHHSPAIIFNLSKSALYSWNTPQRKIQINENMQIFRLFYLPFTFILLQLYVYVARARVRQTTKTSQRMYEKKKEMLRKAREENVETSIFTRSCHKRCEFAIFFSLASLSTKWNTKHCIHRADIFTNAIKDYQQFCSVGYSGFSPRMRAYPSEPIQL